MLLAIIIKLVNNMRYGIRLSYSMMVLVVRWNMLPIFYDNGELQTRLKLEKYEDGTLYFRWARGDEPAHAYLRPLRTDVERKGFRLDIRISKLPVKLSNDVAIEPIDDGVAIHVGKIPDIGKDPKISPVYIKRVNFKTPKHIPYNPSSKNTIRIYLMRQPIKEAIRGKFKALSHIGGTMFMFTRNPFTTRRPFLEIVDIKEEYYDVLYTKLPVGLMTQLGFAGRTYPCFDFIQDIDDNYYLRLIDEKECG